MDPDGAIEHWSEFDHSGHFPAMETPDLLTDDLRDFFRKTSMTAPCPAIRC
jgi:epoxide hydrolase